MANEGNYNKIHKRTPTSPNNLFLEKDIKKYICQTLLKPKIFFFTKDK